MLGSQRLAFPVPPRPPSSSPWSVPGSKEWDLRGRGEAVGHGFLEDGGALGPFGSGWQFWFCAVSLRPSTWASGRPASTCPGHTSTGPGHRQPRSHRKQGILFPFCAPDFGFEMETLRKALRGAPADGWMTDGSRRGPGGRLPVSYSCAEWPPQPSSPRTAGGIGQHVCLPPAAPSSTVGESAWTNELHECRLLGMTKSDRKVTSRQAFLLFQPT